MLIVIRLLEIYSPVNYSYHIVLLPYTRSKIVSHYAPNQIVIQNSEGACISALTESAWFSQSKTQSSNGSDIAVILVGSFMALCSPCRAMMRTYSSARPCGLRMFYVAVREPRASSLRGGESQVRFTSISMNPLVFESFVSGDVYKPITCEPLTASIYT